MMKYYLVYIKLEAKLSFEIKNRRMTLLTGLIMASLTISPIDVSLFVFERWTA